MKPVEPGLQSGRRTRTYWAGAAGLALFLLPLLAYYADRGVRHVAPDYNEGWNAFFTDRAMDSSGRLYPGASELVFNNYPPLSFYVVGPLGRLTGDNIFAGRLVSAVAFAVIAALVALVVARRSQSPGAGLFASLLFATLFAAFPGGRIGLDDPQLLGHAVMTGGLAIVWLSRPTFRHLLAAAALMVAALLIKHNLIAGPLAVTVWMAFRGRRPLGTWLTALGIASAAGALLLLAVWGTAPIAGMLTGRRFLADRLVSHGQVWLRLLDIPAALWVMLLALRAWRREFDGAAWYVATSLVVFLLFVGGDGIGPNVAFDLIIALAICLGLALSMVPSDRIAVATVSLLVLHAALTAPLGLLKGLAGGGKPMDAWERETLADIEYLKGKREPALCEDLALCYWAGKGFSYDAFNMRQLFSLGKRDEQEILAPLRNRQIGVVQLGAFRPDRDDERFSAQFSQTLNSHYHLERRSGPYYFFVPD